MSARCEPVRTSLWPAALLALALCACGEDPTGPGPVCLEVPALHLDAMATGELTSGDRRYRDAHIDYYGLRTDGSRTLEVAVRSAEIDPILLLFGPDGRVVAQAFQEIGSPGGRTETASLWVSPEAGCHVVGVTSWATRDEAPPTGGYTIRVSAP